MKKLTNTGAALLIVIALAWLFIAKDMSTLIQTILLGLIIGASMVFILPRITGKP